MKTIKIRIPYNLQAFKLAMNWRGYTQTKLCKEIKGLSQQNLSNFLKGFYNSISEEKLKEIMKHLDFPFNFLFSDFRRVQYYLD